MLKWSYRDGNLKLTQILIELSSNETETVYRYMNNDVIRTVFVGLDEEDKDYRYFYLWVHGYYLYWFALYQR